MGQTLISWSAFNTNSILAYNSTNYSIAQFNISIISDLREILFLSTFHDFSLDLIGLNLDIQWELLYE